MCSAHSRHNTEANMVRVECKEMCTGVFGLGLLVSCECHGFSFGWNGCHCRHGVQESPNLDAAIFCYFLLIEVQMRNEKLLEFDSGVVHFPSPSSGILLSCPFTSPVSGRDFLWYKRTQNLQEFTILAYLPAMLCLSTCGIFFFLTPSTLLFFSLASFAGRT